MKGLEAKTLGLRKVIRHEYKRIVAFMLTVAMVVTNFGTNLTVAFAAGEEESSLFLLNSSELEDAISTALESGDVFDFSSLELKAKQKSLKTSYEKLIGSKAGKVYQLDVDIDSSYATEHTDLQVFYNAGTDDVVFLFINESDMAVTFRANVSGYETARVTVNPNTTNIEDAEGVENAEDYSGTTMVDDEKKPQAEVVKPEGETSESESASDETEAAETEAETPAAEETEAEIELTPEEGSASASISAKKVFRVSTSAEAAGEAPAADAEEETEAETETEAEEPEKETEAPAETTAEETIADETQADETTAADETDGELTEETEAPTEDVTAPDETTGEQPAGNGGSENIGFDNDEQFLEDDSIELAGELNGKAYNTVTIWGSANARAYVVKAEDLTGEAAVEGQYSVDYSVDPVGAATIKGAHTINEGETLYFAVDPQVGYEITEVTANGEPLEEADAADVASASNLEQHEHVYAVEAVTEDLEIVASLEETVGVAHPEFSASYVSSEGVTISLHAEEGILPEGTELSVTEVTDALGDTIKEKMDSETEGTTVHSVLAYDINLLYNGKKLSNSWSESGYVDVTFTGAPIQEMTEASDKVEIVAVDDTSKTQLSAENAAEAEAGELKLETVSEQNVEDAAVEEVGFKAEHFTIYAVAASSGVMAASIEGYNATMKIGETQRLRSDEGGYSASWSSSNTSVLTVTGSGWTAMVTAVGVGTATITHYNTIYGWKQDYDTATITVTADPITGVTLTGDNKVKLFGQVQLNANLQPTTGSATLTWESSDESILTVDETGMVTGRKLGTATITVWAVDHAGHRFSAAKEITVIQATTTEKAQFYYLTTPTADPKSNNSSVWGRNIGTGKIVVTNGIWENNKNMLDSVSSRVVEWPNGTTGSSLEITRTGTYASDWNTIFEAYKAEIERKHGKTITEDDIESIKLKPYKISRNNGTNPDKHVDCTVEIKVKDVYTANYWLWDAGTTGYEYAEAGSYYKNDQTSPTASKYPNTKTVNGVTYTFLGWYDNEALSGEAVTFPYTITDHNVNFYAKYVAGYYVDYDLNGGTWGSAQTKWFKNVGSTVVVVATEPEKTGYDFTGWTYSEDGSRTYHAGDSFVMPEKNVKLTANWTPKEVSYTVNYYWAGTTIPVTKSKTVTGKHFGDVINNEEPVEVAGYTAINAQPSLTLGSTSEANIINFYYYKNVTLVANSDTFEYDGQTKTVSGYKLNGNDIVLEGITAGAEAVNAGEYPATFTGDPRGTVIDGKYIVTDTENGKLTITKKDKLTIQVTGNTNTVTYTGNEQEVTGFTTNAPEDVTVSLANGSQARAAGTTVGTYYMQLKPADFVATSDNYKNIEILVTDGWLKINPNPEELTVTITGNHDRKPYIGQPQSVSGYSDNAPANVTVALKAGKSATATGTNAGHYAMNLTPADFTVSSDNYSNIKVVVVDGYLDITPVTREVVVKIAGHHDTKTYTGEELSVEGYDVVEKPDDSVSVSLKAGHEAKAAGTNVGTYYMGLTADAFEATSTNYNNIKVEVEDGYLTITPADTLVVKVTGNTKTVTYTGEEQEVTDFTTNAPSDVTVTLKAEKVAEAKGTNAGKYYMGLTADDFTATSANYKSIAIDVADGWLEITPVTKKLTVTITGNHDSRVYTGSEQTVTGFTSDAPATVTVDLVSGAVAQAAGTNAGKYYMELTPDNFIASSDNYSSIEVKVNDGYLEITPISEKVVVTIKGHTKSGIKYDGNVQTVRGYDVVKISNTLYKATDFELTGTAEIAKTDAGTYNMNLTAGDFKNLNKNFSNVEFVVEDGQLTIDKAPVTIKANEASKYVGEDDPADYISNPGVVTRIMRWIRPAAAFGATVTSGEVVAGDTLAFKVTRPRAGTDEERGTYTNAVKVAETDAAANANYEITWIPADFHIYEDGLKVEKTVKAPTAPKTVFELGDVMEFNIKVTNTGNTDLKDVIVRDELDGATIGANTGYTVNTDGTATIAELIAGASVNVKATYTVKAADLGNTSFTNKATATAKTENPKKPEGKVTGEDETDPIAIDSRRPAMEITKTVTNLPAGGEGFVEGDTVRFEIKVKNTGNLALSKVTVTDELADTTIEAGAGYVVDNNKAVIADLPLNTEITITASHVVTKADVANKNFKNTVTVTSKVPDPTDPGKETEGPENPAETDTIPTKGVQVQKTVTSKAAAADGKYVAGEKVTFDITVTNTGNTVLGNFRVVDQLEDTTILEGAGYDVTTDAATGLAAAVVNGLAENASITIKAEHTVTEADLRKEHFKNVAVAELTDPQNPDNPKKEEGETPDIPKVDADANWKVTKTVTNLPSRGYFRSSETAEFDIKVENTGNQTLNDIVVADLLSGAELKAGSGYMLNANGTATIATLKVGEAVTLKATYTVTSADVTNKKFVNAATASIGTETETGTTGDIPTRTTGGGNSGGGGGGGSSSGPRDNGSTPSGGPGTTTVTIDPDAVPLANLPNEDGADNLLMIDDEDVPLAALPKTGQSGTNGLVFFLSSMMLAAFVAVTKKREDDK